MVFEKSELRLVLYPLGDDALMQVLAYVDDRADNRGVAPRLRSTAIALTKGWTMLSTSMGNSYK